MNAVIERTQNKQVTHDVGIDHYRLLHLLKNGGMAKVYLAYNTKTRQQVALKLTEPGKFDEKLFIGEVRAMRRLDHPYILSLLDFKKSEQGSYIVMPYIAGGTLQDRIDEQTLTFEDVTEIFAQLTEAVHYMHSCGITHRDIKPCNILLNGNDVYLADFGIATRQDEEVIYLDGPLMGTPSYMAPEMYAGEISQQGDLYALGAVLYQMLTDSLPFDGENASNIYLKQTTEQPLPPSLLNPYLSLALERVILRALQREPYDRFQTAAAFAVAYQKAVAPSLIERVTATLTNTFRRINRYRSFATSQV